MTARLLDDPREAVYQARWLTPDADQLFAPGCLHVRHGRVVRVWEGTDREAIQLGDVAIVPGLINAHTHLEFSHLPRPLANGTAFPDWIRSVIQSRRERSGDGREAIRQGWNESRQAGVSAIGEIATTDASHDELVSADAAGVVYREILGVQEESVAAGLEAAHRCLADQSAGFPTSVRDPNKGARSGRERPPLHRGLSPHAPYSLHWRLFQGLIDLAVEFNAPVAMHLAETREELELLAHRRGGLRDLLQSLGLWRPAAYADCRRPLDYLRSLARCRRALVVHGNYLEVDELDFLVTQPQMSVVYCPRTHAAFGHDPHPWRAMQSRGIRVAIGTDSRASNPDLSVAAELRFLKQQLPCVGDLALLRMATIDAAEALGLSDVLGTLAPGKLARFTVLTPAQAELGDALPELW